MNNKSFLAITTALALSAFGGCTWINSGSISESNKASAGTPIYATVTGDYGLFHITSPKNLTQKANEALLSQCQSGTMTDVQTQLNVRDFFLLVQVYKMEASAVCK
ncbi:MAG: hypothetical protein M0Z37_06650 [Nitrospiraceae bacterium]|jgi:hypothetical protein|nr:hypothetical protein [Nitrospiraceae bacterium]